MPVVITREGSPLQLPAGVDHRSVAEQLLRFSASAPFECFRLKKGVIFAAEVVGTVQLGRLRISILPKTDTSDEERDKDFLLNMLRAAGYVSSSYVARGEVRSGFHDPLEVLLAELAREMREAIRSGIPRRYVETRERSSTIRGRIDFGALSKLMPTDMTAIPVRHTPLLADNLLSQVIRWTAKKLQDVTRRGETRQGFSDVLAHTTHVLDITPTQDQIDRIVLARPEVAWERIVTVAGMLVRRQFIDPTYAGRADAFGMLFPLQHLFERVMRKALPEALKGTGTTLNPKSERFFLLHDASGGGLVRLKPDFVFSRSGEVTLLGDAKWKRFDATARAYGVDRADLYQMAAYLSRYEVDDCIVLAPRAPWMTSGWSASFDVPPGDRRIHLVGVDIEAIVGREPHSRHAAINGLGTQIAGLLRLPV